MKVAGVQMEPKILENERNLQKCLELLELTANEGAQLIVFPECALSGYVFSSLEEALPAAESIPGPSTERIADACRALGVYVVIGILERDEDKCYNAAALLGPGGLIGKHRKAHLPPLGVDRYVNHGDLSLAVYDTQLGKIGMGICYELYFPEHSRVLTLQGAEIIALPTNFPDGPVVRMVANVLVPARAAENAIYLVAVDRVGAEEGTQFLGGSRIVGTLGEILAATKVHEEEIIYAEIDLSKTEEKLGFLSERRPDLYGLVAQRVDGLSELRS